MFLPTSMTPLAQWASAPMSVLAMGAYALPGKSARTIADLRWRAPSGRDALEGSMFTISFVTDTVVPEDVVVLRTAADGWADRAGDYTGAAWQFVLDERDYAGGLEFKFVILPGRWMLGGNLTAAAPAAGSQLAYTDAQVTFPPSTGLVTENGIVAQRLVNRNLDGTIVYDVIVIGSGMGGGVLASALADAGASVLLLEAGSYLFPTHVGNLPRRLLIGQFQKHVWSLWQDFQVINYTNVNGSGYQGAQAFNLGGRSLFWGSLVPQLSAWQLAAWPSQVSDYLLNQGGYTSALHTMNADQLQPSAFQASSQAYLETLIPGWNVLNGPVGVQYMGSTNWSIPAGIFSTAD